MSEVAQPSYNFNNYKVIIYSLRHHGKPSFTVHKRHL